jgi:glycosyltransferase involved in cell wall biosynthesis
MSSQSKSARRPSITGLFFDEFRSDSAWLREEAVIVLPPTGEEKMLRICGEAVAHPGTGWLDRGLPSLLLGFPGCEPVTVQPSAEGPWNAELPLPAGAAEGGAELRLVLLGVSLGNSLAWLGRVSGAAPLQRFRGQPRNRQLRIRRIETSAGEAVCDLSLRGNPFPKDFLRRRLRLGMNVVGFIGADLGIGESARCMLRAADAARIPAAAVPLRLPCKNSSNNTEFTERLSEANPHEVNVFHIDPPVSRDIDHHHGAGFRKDRHNIGYWAWELPEFPEAWTEAFEYYDEIWCPSDFVREAVAEKSPVPVLTMPHAVSFATPTGDGRARFGLPKDRFLFLFLYDLNSYSARKNPQAVLRAFELSGLAGRGAALVIKVHNVKGNETDFTALREAVAGLPDTRLIAETLSLPEVHLLEASCDAFVSLHRSEGFGLAVAESMLLGKPVIATDWSATREFLSEDNGCPVRCQVLPLERSHGPYGKGSHWAEPDAEHAAWAMRRLFSDHALARRLGENARNTIIERFSPEVIGARYRRRLEAISLFR